MQPINRGQGATSTEARLRTMRILWAVLLVTVGLYALVAYFTAPMPDAERRQLGADGPDWLLPLLVILGVVAVLASIVVKRSFAHRAEAERRPDLLQTGMIVAMVLCEMAALFGLVGLFLTGDRYAYVLFAVGAVGMLLHFPSRDRLLAAAPRTLG
jgi:F0F1-type ATP synthase membrane subunit c/vacuolar-type H+-ATPase subunit K